MRDAGIVLAGGSDGPVEEKFRRNFRVNGEMREKIMEYDLLLDEF